jgi:hypothetical protein
MSGNYNDLSNKPIFPVNVSSFSNDAGYINAGALSWTNIINKPVFATIATTGNYADLINKPLIPTSTLSLINDAGFINNSGRAYPRRNDGTGFVFIW